MATHFTIYIIRVPYNFWFFMTILLIFQKNAEFDSLGRTCGNIILDVDITEP